MRRAILLLFFGGLVQAQTSPTITSVVDPYTGSTTLCPGDSAAINGQFLGTAPVVTVGSQHAYTLTPPLNTGRMIIQIPVDAPLGATTVQLSLASGATSNAFPITISPYAPVLISSASGSVVSPVHRQSGTLIASSYPAAPGESIAILAIGLGATNPSVATGTAAPANTVTVSTPTLTFDSQPVSDVTAGLVTGQIAIYQVNFTVPAGTATGAYPVVITIGGATSNVLTLPVGPAPLGPAIVSVLDAVTFNTVLCPGDLAVVSGVNFGASPQATVNGKMAPLTSSNSNQIVIQISPEAATGSVNVTVTSGGQTSPQFAITLVPYAPALYSLGSALPPVHQTSGAPVTSANPAIIGETVVIYSIGLGAGDPSTTPVTLSIGGNNPVAGVTASSSPGQAGVYQIICPVSQSFPTGNVLLRLQVGSPNPAQSNYVTIPVALSAAGPTISGLANNYSYTVPGLPNYGIAEGAIFDIFGANLTGVPTSLQHAPLSTTLGGVTVSVTVNGKTTQAFLYFTTPTQVAAVLPSSTAVGDGTLTLNNGFGTASTPIHVVQSAFGILTLNQSGTGPASAFDLNYNPLGFNNALNPGDYFVLWGSGVGPVSGADNVTQTPVDLTNVPFAIEVGGLPAQLVYHGRSQYPGLDQVIGIVPQGVTPGCWVSVVTRSGATGNIVSNFATLPVAPSGRSCSDATLGVSTAQMQSLAGMSSIRLGALVLQKSLDTQFSAYPNVADFDTGVASFLTIPNSAMASAVLGPSLGSCVVTPSSQWPAIAATALDAGAAVTITGGAGEPPSLPSQTGQFVRAATPFGSYLFPAGQIPYQNVGGGYFGGLDSPGQLYLPDSGTGHFTIANGSGGGGVGPFQVTLDTGGPWLSWTQGLSLQQGNISLSRGLTLTWTGGDANSFVLISGRDAVAVSGPIIEFTCATLASANQFAIPSAVLNSLPASGAFNYSNPAYVPVIQIAQVLFPKIVTIPNLDLVFIEAIFSATVPVTYN